MKRRRPQRRLAGCLQQAVPTNSKVVGRAGRTSVLCGYQLEESHGFLDQALGSEQVGVLEVAVVEPGELVRASRRVVHRRLDAEIIVHVVDRLAEDGDLLDEALQSQGVDGVQGAVEVVVFCDETSLLLCQLLDPDVHQTLETASSEVGQRGVAAEVGSLRLGVVCTGGLHDVRLELQALAQLLGKPRELLLVRERAEHNENLLPLLQISVLDDVVEVVGHDGLEEAQVGELNGAALEVRLLCAREELLASLDREQDGIREAVG